MQAPPVGLSSVSVGPIEARFASLGTGDFLVVGAYGCGLRCSFCMNHDVAHVPTVPLSPHAAAWIAERSAGLRGVLFTHSEPLVVSGLVGEVSSLVRPSKVVAAKTNAHCNRDDFLWFMRSVDAINVDVKGGREEYRNLCEGSLDLVVRNLELAKDMGKVVELTFLVIPGMESGLREAMRLVSDAIGGDRVVWVTGFVPSFKMKWWPMARKDHVEEAVISLREYFKDARAT